MSPSMPVAEPGWDETWSFSSAAHEEAEELPLLPLRAARAGERGLEGGGLGWLSPEGGGAMEPPHPQLRQVPWSEKAESPRGPASGPARVEGQVVGSRAGSGWRSLGPSSLLSSGAPTLRIPCLSLWLDP